MVAERGGQDRIAEETSRMIAAWFMLGNDVFYGQEHRQDDWAEVVQAKEDGSLPDIEDIDQYDDYDRCL